MGIKHLWTIFAPFCDRKPLYELQGKTLAIDLSCWICEAQNVAEYQIQPHMYLRNLYFRACFLLLMEVNPVFILEGEAPELKYDTIAARNALQFKGAKPKTGGVKAGKARSRFAHVLKKCEEMLGYMGLSCIKGKGEAECLCAYLNNEGLVDGCISQDSDCFAYGARIVYRNFSIAAQGAYSANGGAVDIYDISKINERMNFGRNKVIAMALLCGSDYSDGVSGIGKETVLKFFENLPDEEILETLRSWRRNTEKYDKFDQLINDKNICTACGHHGKIQGHNKNGCGPCGMTKSCNGEKFKKKRLKIKNELSMRDKALQDPDFPNEELIQEFLTKKDKVSKLDLKWRQPNVLKFVQFTSKFLQWEEIYAFEKILPILTRWQCLNPEFVPSSDLKGILQPSYIKKVRNPKGVPSYEIIWSDPEEHFVGLIPKKQIEESNSTPEKLLSTLEPQMLVNKAYPKLVEEYQQSKFKPKKSTRRRKDANIEELGDILKNTSISEPKSKRTRKTTKKKGKNQDEFKFLEENWNDLLFSKTVKKTALLDNFLKQSMLKNQQFINKKLEDLENKEIENDIVIDVDNCHTSTPSKSLNNFGDKSCFGDEDDDDLSLIIENIISKKPTNLQQNLGGIFKDLKFNEEGRNKNMDIDFLENTYKDFDDKKNHSNFFITEPIEYDLFEKTFNELKCDESDNTIEYDFDELEFVDDEENTFKNNSIEDFNVNNNKEKETVARKNDKQHISDMLTGTDEIKKIDVNKEDDSFCDIYVPLLDRLKNKK